MVAITGAGRGIGQQHAFLFAREGAKVVVNDVDAKEAQNTVDEIKKMGGDAAIHTEDCSSMSGGKSLIQTCIDKFGGIDTLVNNAGILRDRTFVNMKEEEWDAIMKVHLKGTFSPSSAALEYWRQCATEGKPRKGRIINTSSVSGLYGNYGQTNYAVAKAGLAALTIVLNAEVERLGVRVNCLTPNARTRMTLPLGGIMAKNWSGDEATGEYAGDKFDDFHPRNMSPLVVFFGSDACEIGGAVILVNGRTIFAMEGWKTGKSVSKGKPEEMDVMWSAAELAKEVPKIYQESERHQMYKNLDAAEEARKRKAKAKL